MDVVRALHRSPDGHAILGTGDSHHAVRLDVQLLLRPRLVLPFDNEGRGRERLLDMTSRNDVALEDVVAAPDDRASLEGIVDREHRRLGLDIDSHVTAGLLEQLPVSVREEHHRLFEVIDAIPGEIRLVVEDQRDRVTPRNIRRSDDRRVPPRPSPARSRFP